MAKSSKINYRAAKKLLNKFHTFSFPMPRKGKDFEPWQKGQITKVMNRLGGSIDAIKNDKGSFVPYPKGSKLKGTDGLRTDKGIFFKFPGAKAAKIKLKDKAGRERTKFTVVSKFKKMHELLIPFPDYVSVDPEKITTFVGEQLQIYKPDYVMLNVNGSKGRRRYDPDNFLKYGQYSAVFVEGAPYYVGVFMGYEPD